MRANTYQIHGTTNKVILHTRTILGTTTTNLHNTVLLDIVTLTGDNSCNDLAGTQTNTSSLALTRVRLLGLGNTSLQTHTLQRRVVFQGRGPTAASALTLTAASADLVVGCADNGRAGKLTTGSSRQDLRCLSAEDGLEVEAAGDRGCSVGEAVGRGGGKSAQRGA